MSMSAGTAYVDIEPDFTGLNQKVAARVAPLAKDFGGKFGKALGPVMAQQSKHLASFTRAAKIATVGAAGLAAYGFKDVVEAGMQFEKQMDINSAVSEATRRQMALLEKQALKLGKATFFSANETAEAQAELIKGGLKVGQVLGGGLPAALSLAEAGQLDLATSAETTVNAMKLFGLEGSQASSVADMLSTAANRTTADVLDFAMALKQGGSVTKLAGYEMNNTVSVLEALAEAGIKNSDAGTSMKAAVIQLLKPNEKQAKLAKELGIHWTTQAGTLKTAAGLSKELRLATGDMTKAERAKTLATLAGTDGVRTLNALYSETPAHLRVLEVANAKQGTAQEIARKKMGNLAGQVEQFKGSLETAEIQIYKGMAPALKDLTEEATKAANNVTAVFEDRNLSGSQKVEKAIDVLSDELGGIWDRNDMTDHLVDVMDAAIPIVAEHAGKLGFEAAKGFGKGFLHADLVGKVVMATWLLHFVGGKAPFIGIGKKLGKQLGFSLATEAAATAGPVIAAQTAAVAASSAKATAVPWTPASPWLGSGAAKAKAAEKTARALLEQQMAGFSLASLPTPAAQRALETSQVSRFSGLGTKLGQVTGARMTEQLSSALRGAEPTLQARFRTIGGRLAGAAGTWGLGGLIVGQMTKDLVGGAAGRDIGNALQGAGVGATIGTAIAPGIGTAIGAALGAGALAGPGLLEDIFGSDKELTPLQQRLRASAKQVAEAFREQRDAGKNLVASHHRLSAAQKGQKQADHAVKRATEQLSDARKRYGRNSNEAARAEQRLRNQKALSAAADRKLENVGKLHGVERRAAIRLDRAAVIAAKESIQALQSKRAHLSRLLRLEQQQPPSKARLEGERKLSKRLNETSQQLTSTKEKEARVIKEAASQIGSKYARSLERLSASELRVVESGRSLKQANREAAEAVFGFSRKAVTSTGQVKTSYERLKGAMGPFRSESHNKLVRAAGDVDSWKRATTEGIGVVQTSFNQFAARLGIASKTFGVSGGGGREQKKQTGGFIVPGTGSGDTFRTALPPGSFIENREAVKALAFARGGLMPVALEPGERVYMPPEVKALGQRTLEARSKAVPRFQKGGPLGKPVLTGPDGALLDLGQAAINQVYKGAKVYLDKHRPSEFAGLGNAPPALRAAMALAQRMGLSITSTTGGEHATNSWHYKGRAFDASNGVGTPEEMAYALAAAKRWGRNILELFYDPLGWYIKNGQKISGAIGGHSDHVHTAMQRGGLLQKLAKGGGLGEDFQQKAQRVWEAAAPFYGQAGASMPRTFVGGKLNQVTPFEDGSRRIDIARWNARDFMRGRDWAEGTVPHEWAHFFQKGFTRMQPWEREGGAEAFERWAAPQIYGALGLPFHNPSRPNYPAYVKRVIQEKGWDWIKRGQFLQRGGLLQKLARGGWVKTGYTTYDVDGPGAFGDLMKGKGYAELGTATSGGSGTGTGFIAKALGMKGELPEDYPLDVKIGQKIATLFKRDRGYGQGDPFYSIDIHRLAWPDVGLSSNSKGNAFIRPADGAASGSHELPKQQEGTYTKHKAGSTSGGGGTYGQDIKGKYRAPTEKISFGSLPDNLHACTKELRHLQETVLPEYQAALRHSKDDPHLKRANEANIKLIRQRISALKKQRIRLMREEATKKAVKRITEAAEFATWTKPNVGIFDQREDAYNLAQELADQTVSLEPEEPSGAGVNWVKNVLEPYVNNVESPAFARVLGAEAEWRNSILGAENFAGEKIAAWKGQITGIQNRIEEIQGFRTTNPNAWDKFKDLIPGLKQRMKALRGDVIKTRVETLPEWEDALGGVQGLGRTHEVRAALPAEPTMEFGGNIFETQQAIKGLGLKVSQALQGVTPDTSEQLALAKELARQASQRAAASEIAFKVFSQYEGTYPPYAGKAHSGAVVPGPPTQERTMIVRGEERIRTPEQELAMATAIRGLSGGGGGVTLSIDQLIVHPDGTATAKVDGTEVRGIVRKVIREDPALRLR